MGAAQSAQRQGKKDAAAEEESGKVDDARTQQNIDDKPLKNNGQIAEINGKADDSKAEVNGQCEDEIVAEVAILSPGEDVSETEKPRKEEETPLKNVEDNEKKSTTEDVPLEIIEMNAKQNDINEGFRRFFSNIGLKLTVKRGSTEKATHVPDETNKEEPNRPEDANDTKSKNAELNADVNIAPESYDNDSTTCPTLTDVTSEDVLENAKEETAKTREEAESNNAEAATGGEDAHQDASPKEDQLPTSPSSPEEEVVVSPIKRFFTTGIFSGLRKKKKPADDETTEKELVDMEKKEVIVTTEQAVQDQQQDKKEISPGVKAAADHKENEFKEEILSVPSAQTSDEGKSSSTDPSTIIVTDSQILSSQEKDKVQASPLKRLLSGSNLKKLSKKQRSRNSSDAKLSDSGEHVSDQLLSSTESAENQKEEGPPQPSAEAARDDDGAWASFIKLLTPKKRMKRSSLSNEETKIPGSVEEPKPSEGEQISDQSTEEGKKRKDSSVSWEAVLCGSGRRRSRKTSDSEDETPDNNDHKPDDGSKHVAESPESSNENENEILASSPKQAESPSEGDGTSTWKSLKKLVTPKRRVKDEDESKDNIQSDSEVTQDESSFSIKKLLPGRKKRKSAEKQEQVSSDEADKDVDSGDEDSETPAVIPLSEFDTVETEVNIQTQADIESHIPEEENYDLQQDLLDQIAEPVLPCDSLYTEAKKVQENNSLEKPVSATPAKNEEPDDLTESVSKHQQLSDIPEEGVITETMATPASATGEAARDDTIAEDLIEITSEAITAPEPASDITFADETEMISAVSQLSSESSKTSGNATPVPVENDIIDTDRLLHQVVETISVSPKAVPVCSDELSSEKIIGSVSHQTSETLVKEEPKIPEIHRRLDTTAINTGLNADELAATSQTESISELNDSVSTEVVSEVPTEEFDTAEMAPDEIRSDVTYPEESLRELERINDSHPLVECLSEINTSVSTDLLPEGEEIVPEVGSLVEAHQTETELPKIDFQDADSAATVADEIKDEAMEQQVQTETENEALLTHNITDQIQAEDKDQAPAEVEELQELAAVQVATLDSQKGSVQLLEKEVVSEDIPAAETVELKEEMLPLTEVCVEPEKEDKLKTDAAKTEHGQVPEASEPVPPLTIDSEKSSVQVEEDVKSEDISPAETVTDEELPVNAVKIEHKQVPEVIEAVPAPTLDSEEGSVESTEEEFKLKDIPPGEPLTDEPKQTTEHLTEVCVEPDKKELTVNTVKTEHVQELEVKESVPAPTINLEKSSVQIPEKDVKSEDILPVETVKEEAKKTAEHLTDVRFEPEDEELPVNAVKIEQNQVPEVIEAVPAPTLDSEKGSVQMPEEDVKSEVILPAETVTEEPKKNAEHLTDVSFESDDKELPGNAVKTEHVQVLEVIEAVPATTLDSEKGSVQMPEEDVKSEDILPAENVTEESKNTAEHLNDVSFEPEDEELPVNAVKIEHNQVPEVIEAVPEHILDSEEGGVQLTEEEVKSKDNSPGEPLTDELKQMTEHLTEVCVEPDKKELTVNAVKIEHNQVPEVIEAVPEHILDSEEGGVQLTEEEVKSKDNPPGEPLTDELKRTTEHLTEVCVEPENKELPVNAVKIEHNQVPDVIEAVPEHMLDSEEGDVQSPKEKVKLEDIPAAETVTDELKEEILPLTEVCVEPKKEAELERDAAKTENVQIPAASEAVPAPTVDSEKSSVQVLEEDVKSEDISPAETVTEEPKKNAEHLTDVRFESDDKELPGNAVKTEHVQVPEVIEAVPAPTLDSEKGSVQMPEEDVKSEDILPAETVKDEPKKNAEHLTDVSFESDDKELPGNAVKTEHVQVIEVIEAVPATTLDSEKSSVQMPEEDVKSEDILPAENVTEEPKKTAEHLTHVRFEPGDEELPVNAVKIEHNQVPEVIEAVPEHILDSEEGSVQSLEKEVTSGDVPKAETVTDEPKEDTIHLTEDNLEPVDASKPEHVQELKELQAVQAATLDPEVGNLLSLEKKVKFEDIPAVEIVTAKPKQENDLRVETDEKQTVEAAQTKPVQEPEVLTSDVKDIVPETKSKEEALMYVPIVKESIERVVTQGLPKPDTTSVIASVADETEIEVLAQLGEALQITQDQKTESIPQDVRIEQKDCIPEAVDELQTLTALHVSSVNEESSNVQVLGKTVLSEENLALCVDNAVATDELKHEVYLSAVQVHGELEKEGELPGNEIKTAAVEHAVVAQVVVCNLKDVSDPIPDILIEKTSETAEPLIETMASELVFKEESEAAAPLVKDDVIETAEEGSAVVMMHVPSVTFEDSPSTQVQVVDVDIKSAETAVDSVLEVGIIETKEVLDVCQERVERVANLTLTQEIEEELLIEENKVTIQEVTQHVLENLPETVPESLVVNLEKEVIKQPDEVTKVSEMVESKSNDVEDQKVMDDSFGQFRERQDEAPAVIRDDSSADRQLTEDPMQTCDIPGSLDVSINDHKENLEETKAEQEKPEEGVTAEEVKSLSKELDEKKNHEQALVTQIAQSPIETPSNTGLLIAQNTGIISSIGNVEPPSSLSLEFKLNTPFGQAEAPVPPPPETASVKLTEDVSEVRVQAVEAESQKQTELTKAGVQSTEITEPAATRAIVATQPVLLDVGIKAEIVESVEQIQSTERVSSSVQSTESIQPVRPTETREVFLSQAVLAKACVQETKSEEPEQIEEEYDQDVWMDAEEVINTEEETKVSILEVEEPLEPQTESEEQQKAGTGHDVETAPESKTEEEESQQEIHKTGETCEIESESEDFAVAVEQLETATTSVMESD